MSTTAVLSSSRFVVNVWQPGFNYNPGDVVQPTAALNVTSTSVAQPTNPDFVASLAGWTATANVTWNGGVSYNATGGSAAVAGATTGESVTNQNQVAVTVGQTINAYCYMGGNASIPNTAGVTGFCRIVWYDNAHTQIGTTDGAVTNLGGVGGTPWTKVLVSGSAPSGTSYAAIAGFLTNPSAQVAYMDAFYWDYIVPAPAALDPSKQSYFTSISSGVATSAGAEPDWTNGGTNVGNVVDGGVTWARGIQESIVWRCQNFCDSGLSEPVWTATGLTPGSVTPDGTAIPKNAFDWITRALSILDTNCPQSKYVVIGASHVLAGDNDIVRFSAVTNPLDWTSEADAGFIGTGLQAYGSNPVAAMGMYRSNLVVFNSEGMQMWQLDEDPANMAMLDAIPIGSTYQKALAPMNDDLFFLAAQGVRTIGISIGSGSLMSGDVGMPIDPIVQAGIAYAKANNVDPLGVYYPSYGQYWIVFPGYVPASSGNPSVTFRPIAASGPYSTGDSIFVYTRSRQGEVGAWSRYVVPFHVSGFFFLNDDLCIRSGDDVLKVDPAAVQDYAGDTYNSTSRATVFPGAVQWPYLDCGPVGLTKKFDTMDIACSQSTSVTVEIGYDQTNPQAFTTPFTMPADSIPGMQIPIPIMGPSISIRLSFTSAIGVDPWQVDAVNVYVQDQAVTS